MNISKEKFGITLKGKNITEYILENDLGFKVNIIDFGGIITGIFSPNKEGKIENIVLNYKDISKYEENSTYFGAIIGRTAGRIANSEFEIENTKYPLAANNGVNNLHGGIKGFNKVLWSVTEFNNDNEVGLILEYTSKDMEEGFPGSLNVKVKYTVNNDNELKINYEATTNKTTLVNLTNHTYFNLSGEMKEDIQDHYISIDSSKYVEVDAEVMPTGKTKCVEGTAFDLRKKSRLGDKLILDELSNWSGYDHPFLLNKNNDISILLEHPKSGRKIEVTSDQSSVVFYSGNQLINENTADGTAKKHYGLCLELQEAPGCIEKIILKPDDTYNNYCIFKFSVK